MRNRIAYNKLIRDRIPEIIQHAGKKADIQPIGGDKLKEALGQKILEEAFELYNEWQQGDKENILKESADLLEIVLAALKQYDLSFDDLKEKQNERANQRGTFQKNLFLKQVYSGTFADHLPLDFEKDELLQYNSSMLKRHDQPCLIFNPKDSKKLIKTLHSELEISVEVRIASAFYSPGQSNLLITELDRFLRKGGQLKAIFSTMGHITHPEHLSHFQKHLPKSELRIFHPPEIPFDQTPPNFHVKTWLFRHGDGSGAMLIGSSNFTQAGFHRNVEWNYFTPLEINLMQPSETLGATDDGEEDRQNNDELESISNRLKEDEKKSHANQCSHFENAIQVFDRIWQNDSVPLSNDFLRAYQIRFQKHRPARMEAGDSPSEKFNPDITTIFESVTPWGESSILKQRVKKEITPNAAQKLALEKLVSFRDQKIDRAAVIAATGIGKTVLSALDFKQSQYRTVLFIAHREKIVMDAMKTFREILNEPNFGQLLGGGHIPEGSGDSTFAMIQTISRTTHMTGLAPEAFEYIVIDEFHHSEATTYQKILDYFRPKFLLGLTATPERMDGRNVLAYCDYNVACDIRLMDAIQHGWLTPFQYFAIYDETDYEKITWRGSRYDEAQLEAALNQDTRTKIVAKNLKKYLPSFGKIKALAFCSSVSHAIYTAKHLSEDHAIPAMALHGGSSHQEREDTISSLQRESDPLNVICTVDIFNEGVDIPEITHVLLLRPTLSFTLFLQQLGRGLRLSPDKSFLVVLDFIGNFRKVHIAPLALCGCTTIESFVSEKKFGRIRSRISNLNDALNDLLPAACHLSADIEVKQLWEKDLKQVFLGAMSLAERLKLIYHDIKADLELDRPLNLLDLLSNAYDIDPGLYLKSEPFGSWLKARLYCDKESCAEEEHQLIDTSGEEFLRYLEAGLNPTRSYKMVVIESLLNLGGDVWRIEDIATEFLNWFLRNPQYQKDFSLFDHHSPKEMLPISKVISRLKQMPLDKLSNKTSDCFIMDRKANIFSLKSKYRGYWKQPFFREMVEERISYLLRRYFSV